MVRVKYRYVCFRIAFEDGRLYSLSAASLLDLLKDAVQEEFGDWGYAMVVPKTRFIEYKPALSTGIARTPLSAYKAFCSSLSRISSINHVRCRFAITRASGIIKKAREAVVEMHRSDHHHPAKAKAKRG